MSMLSDERFIEHLEQVFDEVTHGVAYFGVGVKAVAEAAIAADRAARSEPVLTVQREPDYWSRGHFYEGSRSWVDPAQVKNLPVGTKLYTAPPDPPVVPEGMVLIGLDFLEELVGPAILRNILDSCNYPTTT